MGGWRACRWPSCLALSWLVVLSLLPGCPTRGGSLTVFLLTAFAPGVEVFSTRTTLTPAEDPSATPLRVDHELAVGVTLTERPLPPIAEFGGLALGEYRARIELFGADGTPVQTRNVLVRVNGTMAISVSITRSCEDVVCPGAGQPETFTECVAGRCEEATTPCTDVSCGMPECATSGDCPAPTADCAVNACVEGVCVGAAVFGACDEEPGTVCSPAEGCSPVIEPEPPIEPEEPCDETTEECCAPGDLSCCDPETDPTCCDPSVSSCCGPRDLDCDGALAGPDDCNDGDATIAAGEEEFCGDGIDQDCDGADEPCDEVDLDDDGVPESEDCDDGDASVSLDEEEVCDDEGDSDEDCNGFAESCDGVDADEDGYDDGDDCDDDDVLVNPDALEICGDGVDQDCDGEDDTDCVGHYAQPCAPHGLCLESPRQHLACTRAPRARTRSCLRCCALCENQRRYHWLNVDQNCAAAAERYCGRAGRGGLEDDSSVDPVQWGTCAR